MSNNIMKKSSLKNDEVFIEITPESIDFMYDSREISPGEVVLRNLCTEWVAFKVKTNTRKRYIVQPVEGILKPKSKTFMRIFVDENEVGEEEARNAPKFQIQAFIFLPVHKHYTIGELLKNKTIPKQALFLKANFIERSSLLLDEITPINPKARMDTHSLDISGDEQFGQLIAQQEITEFSLRPSDADNFLEEEDIKPERQEHERLQDKLSKITLELKDLREKAKALNIAEEINREYSVNVLFEGYKIIHLLFIAGIAFLLGLFFND